MKRALGVVLVALLAGSALLTHAQEQAPDARAKLAQVLAEQKVSSNFDAGWVAIPCDVVVRGDLLEYLLVNERGAAHESLLGTTVVPSVLNTALLALGLSPGTNARWVAKQGADAAPGAFEVLPPEGDGLYLHVAGRRGRKCTSTGAAMRRQKFVYLGSRMVTVRAEEAPVYAADVEGNLVNVSFFEAGHTVLTTSAPECVRQTVWLPNGWLLPQTGQAVQLIFARNRLSSLPDELLTHIPDLGPLPAER